MTSRAFRVGEALWITDRVRTRYGAVDSEVSSGACSKMSR